MSADPQRDALRRIASEDPKLAARLVLMTLPAAARSLRETLAYELTVEGVGSYRVAATDGGARVDAAHDDAGPVDFRLTTDPQTLVEMALGEAKPLGLMLRGRLRIRGKRRRALKLRAMADSSLTLEDVVAAGGRLDPDVLYRSLPHLIDPKWTEGHSFTLRYVIAGEGGGSWFVQARDGERLVVDGDRPEGELTATVRMPFDAYQKIAAGRMTPNEAMQRRVIEVDGQLYPVTLLGRWIDRSQERDDAEQKREARQRKTQAKREGLWSPDRVGHGQGDPGHDSEVGRSAGDLLDYRQLYALWERQNWKAHELDFSVDREQWVATPSAAQQDTIWSLGSFYVGEERVTADLAPFLVAAPSGEIELFLATQLVDEARHAAFFDRFGGEVMALSADDLRGRMREVEERLLSPWRDVFDDGLRDVSKRIQAKPDDLDLFVEGITTYHMIVEGFLAVTGQTLIRDWMTEHSLYPGFVEGFGLVERDEHRHVAFGVRFLRDAIAEDSKYRDTVERTVLELAPRAAHVFVPPYAESPVEFESYGYGSRVIYGQAYRTLKRRMKVLGIELPPASELMPGPIAELGDTGSYDVPEGEPTVSATTVTEAHSSNGSNGSGSNGAGDLGRAESAPS
ncbi:MAG TPA: SCP2 sterol-binding domain-containing protein [Thermoleophilaceae bacterium]|nr:SCP2 sterol-binding domain-containing protein [Thermoleophilaceae bacterium]